MKVEFFFDPSCPFCWITSRWLLMISSERDVAITWKQFSLAIKNDELAGGGHEKTPHGDIHRPGHRIHRVIRAAVKNHNANLIDLYTAFGIPHHVGGEAYDDELIKDVLEQQNLPAELLKSANDKSLDAELEASTNEAVAAAGKDIGVPTIVFNISDKRNGYFGPVLQSLPDKPEALKLWDGLSLLATNENFYELKRTRPDGGPDVFSTAKC